MVTLDLEMCHEVLKKTFSSNGGLELLWKVMLLKPSLINQTSRVGAFVRNAGPSSFQLKMCAAPNALVTQLRISFNQLYWI